MIEFENFEHAPSWIRALLPPTAKTYAMFRLYDQNAAVVNSVLRDRTVETVQWLAKIGNCDESAVNTLVVNGAILAAEGRNVSGIAATKLVIYKIVWI